MKFFGIEHDQEMREVIRLFLSFSIYI